MNPAPASRIELYTHEPMVNWLGPAQLIQTGMRALVATTLGSFTDPREVQAALNPSSSHPVIEQPHTDEVWLDYVADTGDGWDATHSVAWSTSRSALLVPGCPVLPRAQVLLLGGDQVYPTPAHGGYRTRLIDPFRSAFAAQVSPNSKAGDQGPITEPDDPLILATPGNHDWYDGLRGFIQVFCNQRPIGRWRTAQRMSYYALKLPHGWWVWSIDLQLDSAIDKPQQTYFETVAQQLGPQDQVLLCTPEPTWIDESERLERTSMSASEKQTPRFLGLRHIEELLGEHLALTLAGDLHHYARYAPSSALGLGKAQRITCGGGGAFLTGTHHLPQSLKFSVSGQPQHCTLQSTYPNTKTSKQLRNQAWNLPLKNASFCALLATLYLLFLWLLQSASKIPITSLHGRTLMENWAQLQPGWPALGVVGTQTWQVLAHSPGTALLAMGIVLAAGQFSRTSTQKNRTLALAFGMAHGGLHVLLALGMLWIMGRFNLFFLPQIGCSFGSVDDPFQVLCFVAQTIFLGGFLGGVLFGSMMVLANILCGWHSQEVFSSQRIADFKCFLRMHICAEGLTIYPLKIDKVCTHWTLGAQVTLVRRVANHWLVRAFPGATARFVPKPGCEPVVQPIEPPIHIPCKK
jgi:hypothetical protein